MPQPLPTGPRSGRSFATPCRRRRPTPIRSTCHQSRRWALWLEEPPGHCVVACDGARVLGSAKMGPNRPAAGAHIGTASFMVDSNARGAGIGRQLADFVIAWHRERGYLGIQFNAVVETNSSAVHLWQDRGFEIIGTVPGAFRSPTHGDVGLHIMFLDLRQE
ncbi:GNAT family N-acetyltransferase [Demetria terragena]|uniref:GNAT family N-acetyltransferase n=1 Tax=Demetria terragena TaxID=63959 RepID=UPI001FE23932|nr:GNAT family N-acetyltransferase [Demetria terragena]